MKNKNQHFLNSFLKASSLDKVRCSPLSSKRKHICCQKTGVEVQKTRVTELAACVYARALVCTVVSS